MATERFEYAKKIKSAIGEEDIYLMYIKHIFEYAKKIKSAIGEENL